MDSPPRIEMTPIGVVLTDVPDDEIAHRRRDLVSTIEVLPRFAPALDGLDEYSHLIVLFWMARTPPFSRLRQHPRRGATGEEKGALALRTRNRPNPIGLAVVELLSRVENRLQVRRLDAYHGTAILDIKPYDHYDVVSEPRVPAWSNSAPRA